MAYTRCRHTHPITVQCWTSVTAHCWFNAGPLSVNPVKSNSDWQGHTVSSGRMARVSSGYWCNIARLGSLCQQWTWLCYCQNHSITLSEVDLTVLLPGSPCQQWTWLYYFQDQPVSSGSYCTIARSLSQQWPWLYYCQDQAVSSGHDFIIARITLSAVDLTVLLPGSPCQQWTRRWPNTNTTMGLLYTVHSIIDNTAYFRPLKSLEHCILQYITVYNTQPRLYPTHSNQYAIKCEVSSSEISWTRQAFVRISCLCAFHLGATYMLN